MWENRTCGSEGGVAIRHSYPYQGASRINKVSLFFDCQQVTLSWQHWVNIHLRFLVLQSEV